MATVDAYPVVAVSMVLSVTTVTSQLAAVCANLALRARNVRSAVTARCWDLEDALMSVHPHVPARSWTADLELVVRCAKAMQSVSAPPIVPQRNIQ